MGIFNAIRGDTKGSIKSVVALGFTSVALAANATRNLVMHGMTGNSFDWDIA